MKKIQIYFLVAILFVLGGCGDDWFDINQDPNALSSVPNPELILPGSEMAIANGIMGWQAGFSGAFWSQYWTQDYTSSQFKYLDEYDETQWEYTWDNIIPSALTDLKRIKNNSEQESGEFFVAEALSIYSWQIITDLWGDVPYSESLQGEDGVFSPAFETQESIYTDLMKRIDALLAADYSDATLSADFDFIYEGDMDNWMAFAKSLKLKLMIRLSETSGYDNSTVLSFVNQGGFITESASIPGSIWEDKDTKRHPMAEFEDAGYFDNVIASKTFLDYLRLNGDPRISSYFEENGDGIYMGAFQGDFASTDDVDANGTPDSQEDWSRVTFAQDLDIPLLSTWEVNFYIAEVYARASDFVNAKAYFDAAVDASCTFWGVTNDITTSGGYGEFVSTPVEADPVDTAIQQIAMQKWVSYCKLQHTEAFLERNRVRYPAVNTVLIKGNRQSVWIDFPVGNFTISVAGRGKLSGKLPVSPLYPNAVVSRNTTNPEQKSTLGEPVWWNQKPENEVN